MAVLPVPSNARVVGECIYCASTKEPLTKEHAVPYGLNGPWTLLAASCAGCSDITHRFERDTLKCLYPAIRAVLAMQTRRPKERPRTLPLVLENQGARRTEYVTLTEFPLYLPTPILPPPGVVDGRTPAAAWSIDLRLIHIAGPPFEAVAKRFAPVDFVGARINFAPENFARTLAKIAFAAAVYALGLQPVRQSPIKRVILGQDRAGHLVGTWTGDPITESKGTHAMQLRTRGTDLHVILRLFAQFGAPEYHVVLGPADPEFVRSDAWPWKGTGSH